MFVGGDGEAWVDVVGTTPGLNALMVPMSLFGIRFFNSCVLNANV